MAGFVVRRPQVVRPPRLLRLVPWSVLLLAIRLFVAVDLLVEHSSDLLSSVFGTGSSQSDLVRLELVAAGLANLVDNRPAYLVIEPSAGASSRLVTTLVAVNIGQMLLAWGSLANLLWLRACRARGPPVSMVRLGLEGLLVVPLAVAAGVLAVWLT